MKKILLLLFLCLLFNCAFCQPFITTWNAGSAHQITIPGYGTNYTIAWEEVGKPAHNGIAIGTNTTIVNFGDSGIYKVSISGGVPAFDRINFSNTTSTSYQLLTIEQWGSIHWSNMSYALYQCVNVQSNAIDAPDLSGVTDMSYMLDGCTAFNSNISNWNTANITNMGALFLRATAFNQHIGNWNTANVTNMTYMFYNAYAFNQPIGNWNTANVTDMSFMFSYTSSFNQPIGNWNTVNVINMNNMFSFAVAFNQPIGNWNTVNVTNMSSIFSYNPLFNQLINNWNTANVKNMSFMFYAANVFNQPIGNWNTAKVVFMNSMFGSATNFNQPIGNWNTSHVTDMSGLFYGATAFNQSIGNWNTANVINMNNMFNYASSFNQPIGNWNTANVTNMGYMFADASSFNQPIGNWNTANVANMGYMFADASSFNQPIGNWNTANVANMSSMFNIALSFNQPIYSWNTVSVSNMDNMFSGATSFNQNIGAWNINAVSDIGLGYSGIDLHNYDSILISWNATSKTGVRLSAGNLQYCKAAVQRNNLISSKSWVITGDSKNCTLPIKLINFNAALNDTKVLLQWQTATEVNNAYFMVQRSIDGRNWEDIIKVAGAGNSSTALNYSATDAHPFEGISYYRLQQRDKDGNNSFSEIRMINNLQHQSISVFPNPASDIVHINTNTAGKMQLFNATGVQVLNAVLTIGNNDMSIQQLSQGTYIIAIETSKGIVRNKVVRQ